MSYLLRIGLLASLIAVIGACGSDDDSESFACDGSVSEVQDLVSKVVSRAPGFAGCAPDPENTGGYIIHVTSVGVDIEHVRAEIIAQEGDAANPLADAELQEVGINVTRVSDWYNEAHNRLLTEVPAGHGTGWNWFMADLDEVNQQGIFGYANEDARAWAQQFILDEIDAPPGALVAFLGDPGSDD